MSFLDNFSQWRKLDTKNKRGNCTKMNFPTVNRETRKKRPCRHSFILSVNNYSLLYQQNIDL